LLRTGGHIVFQDDTSIPLGARWDESIERSLTIAAVVVVIWCIHSRRSSAVGKELEFAIGHAKPIIPVRIDETPLPEPLAKFQGIDLSSEIKHSLFYNMGIVAKIVTSIFASVVILSAMWLAWILNNSYERFSVWPRERAATSLLPGYAPHTAASELDRVQLELEWLRRDLAYAEFSARRVQKDLAATYADLMFQAASLEGFAPDRARAAAEAASSLKALMKVPRGRGGIYEGSYRHAFDLSGNVLEWFPDGPDLPGSYKLGLPGAQQRRTGGDLLQLFYPLLLAILLIFTFIAAHFYVVSRQGRRLAAAVRARLDEPDMETARSDAVHPTSE
jgi:hypothetical protein